jgi:hypothetical protein
MEELQKILDLGDKIAQKKAELAAAQAKIDLLKIELGIEDLKAEIEALTTQKEETEISVASMFSDANEVEFSGFTWKIQKGSKSVKLADDINLDVIPEKFVRIKKEPDKIAMKKASPTELTGFAEIVTAPDKITYKWTQNE